MAFKFVRFTQVDDSFAARVTIRQRTGQIGFNAGAVNRFRVRDYKFVVLYFDESARAVGMSFERESTAGAIEIKHSPANTYIRAKNFLDRYGVDYSVSHRHELKCDKDSELLYFMLDEVVDGDGEEESDQSSENVTEQINDKGALDNFEL